MHSRGSMNEHGVLDRNWAQPLLRLQCSDNHELQASLYASIFYE
jgi:hypothetical protein